jgi:magnesium transporter
MIKELAGKAEHSFEWIDVAEPSKEELHQLAEKYHLHERQIEDCLVQDHLPKYENTNEYTFIIFRTHNRETSGHDDTVRELTHKFAVFYSKEYIITIHRHPQDFFKELKEAMADNQCKSAYHLLNLIIKKGLLTYDQPADALLKQLAHNEEQMFIRKRSKFLIKELYFQKRKIDVIRRMLILSYDIIDNIDAENGDVNTRDTRDLYEKMKTIYDALSENTNQLMNIYFSISAQRTNEIMRVLTIFSVFFMPLTFVVGVYGMNFDFMPELKWKLGYPGVMLLMGVITLCIYLWFKKKDWL